MVSRGNSRSTTASMKAAYLKLVDTRRSRSTSLEGGNTPGAGVRYYEQDRLSTRVITNGSGAVVGTLDQLPFGEEAGAAGESEKHKFTSYERDSETGTDYAVNRQYQNTLGRFMRPDPYGGSMSITDPQSFNRYTYVGNDPVNASDPLGLQQDPPLVIDVEDPPPAPQQPIESNDTLVVNTNEPGFFFFFPGFIDRPLLAFVRIDIVIGGLVDADGGGGDFFAPPVPLVPEPPAAPPQAPGPDVPAETERLFQDCLKIVEGHLTDKIANTIGDNNRSNQPLSLLVAHAAVESTLGTFLTGLAGELGLFQLKPSTARSLGLEKFTNKQLRDDFALNTRLATTYLQQQIDAFGGDVRSGLGAYKQGAKNVRGKGLSSWSQIYADAIQKCAKSIKR